MARQIKETPILFGEDARRFEERMNENHKVTIEEKTRIKEAYRIGIQMLEDGKRMRDEGFHFSRMETL